MHEIVVEVVAARPIAAVRRQVQIGHVGQAWGPALDQVWAFLGRHAGLRTDGHNIFIYHHPKGPGQPLSVEFGVEVTGPFEGEGEVVSTHTPAGQVASTLHVGPYERIGDANRAIEAWAIAQGRALGGASWEIYGDPSDDPATDEVQVLYLLA